jgi:predicted enzyme related to lactoylglutathione lyase
MQRVTGLGGIFFLVNDPVAMRDWYRRHLGIDIQEWGGATFPPPVAPPGAPEGADATVWSISGPGAGRPFSPGGPPFVINYRVADVIALVSVLREEGCDVDEKTESSEYGTFGWVTDPEGRRIELWQPPGPAAA